MIDKLIYSLNCLEVKGKTNLDILLGCIVMLEQLKAQMEQASKAETDDDPKGEED